MKHLFIGDVHGNYMLLEKLLNIHAAPDRKVVLLGDYINRNSGSRKTLDLLVDFKLQKKDTVLLRGNHEEYFLNAIVSKNIFPFLAIGGAATMLEYIDTPELFTIDKLDATIPQAHLDLLFNLSVAYGYNSIIATHQPLRLEPRYKGYVNVHGHCGGEPRLNLESISLNSSYSTRQKPSVKGLLYPEMQTVTVD